MRKCQGLTNGENNSKSAKRRFSKIKEGKKNKEIKEERKIKK